MQHKGKLFISKLDIFGMKLRNDTEPFRDKKLWFSRFWLNKSTYGVEEKDKKWNYVAEQ